MTRTLSSAMQQYSIELRKGKYVNGYWLLSFARKYNKQLLDTEPDSLKSACKNVVRNADEFLGNKIPDAATKSNDDKIEKQEFVEEIFLPLEERDEILNKLSKAL